MRKLNKTGEKQTQKQRNRNKELEEHGKTQKGGKILKELIDTPVEGREKGIRRIKWLKS